MSVLPNDNLPLDSWLSSQDRPINGLMNNPLLQKDIWKTIDDLGLKVNQHEKALAIKFDSIQQDWLKFLLKLYILSKSTHQLSAAYLRSEVYNMNRFSHFIQQKSILSVNQINDRLFDEFDYYLNSLNLSPRTISTYYLTLTNFFNLCSQEGWLEVETYWFKGKCSNRKIPKNDEIEYLPEEVWQQLNTHLHRLPEPIQRMVIVIRSTGLRIGELLNLPLDCLRKRGEQWRLRFLTEKYQVIDELPVCEELVIVIKEQQEYIRNNFKDSYDKLFGSNNSNSRHEYIPAPRVMYIGAFNKSLNKLAKEQRICTAEGQVWHFKSHQFRRTLATVMTNAGIRDLIIQKYLRHRSPDMQNHYKHLFKEVLGEEYQELMKGTNYVDSTGKLVANHKPKNLITEVVRRKMHQITTQYGECHRPVLKSPCQTVNACWRCEHWLTSTEDLSTLKQDIYRVETELNIAFKLGMIRQQQGLTEDRQNLIIRIEGLESIDAGD